MLDYLVDVLGFTPEFRAHGPDGSVKFAGAWWGEIGKGTQIVLGDIEEALHGHYDHGQFGEQMIHHPLGTGVVCTSTLRTWTGSTIASWGRVP